MAIVGTQMNCDDTPRQIYHKTLRAVMQVEVFMTAAAVLLFFQLVFGFLRRCSNNAFIQGGLWVSYTLLPPLVIYTLGLMQSSQVVAVIMYPVWALSLFLIAGGANSITAYELSDNRKWKRGLFDILQYDIYFGIIIFQLLYPTPSTSMSILYRIRRQFLRHPTTLPVFILFTAVCFAHTFRTIASWMVTYAYPSKVVADYMKDYAAATVAANSRLGGGDHSKEDCDPVTMKGCKYMVHWPAYKVTSTWNGKSCLYRCEPVPKEGVITVGMIWDERNEEKFISHGLSSSRIKGACLSYSLSHLLRRRFFGMDCAEASLLETRRFIVEGLLSENNASDEFTEAFRVIEMELAFLYDFFYTRYALIFGMEGLFFLMVIVKLVCSFALGVVMLYASLSQRRDPRFRFDDYYFIVIRLNETHVSVTVAIIGVFLVVEALQFVLYLGSDWAMVSLACCSLTGRGSSYGFIPFALRKACGLFISKRRLPLFGYWQNKLGQYSVIQGSKFFSLRKDFAFESSTLSKFIFSKAIASLGQSLGNLFSRKGFHFVKLPEKLKPDIVSILKSSGDCPLTNGKASLQHNGFLQQFSWTLQNETQTESMLIWHIATDYCRIICDDAELRSRMPPCYDNHEVATKLSCYCAYLMSKVPELLPGNSIDTRSIFDEVMYKAREALGTDGRNKDGLQRALAYSGVDNSILTKGLKLGTELEAIKDTSQRWKVMAEFWAETILYIAPSDNANAHMERLAQGGEFLTHLWALLTHAGILNRDQVPLAQGEGLA